MLPVYQINRNHRLPTSLKISVYVCFLCWYARLLKCDGSLYKNDFYSRLNKIWLGVKHKSNKRLCHSGYIKFQFDIKGYITFDTLNFSVISRAKGQGERVE